MNDGPKVVRDLGNGWRLRRWEYDDAPMELHGPKGLMLQVDPRHPETVELEAEFTQYSCCSSYSETLYRDIPLSALLALLGEKSPSPSE